MNYIKSITINGYKRFEKFNIELNNNINIIVGENESGKSTILEAINICLNQLYKNADKSIIKELLNIKNAEKFYQAPCEENLPKIIIEMELEMDDLNANKSLFFGMHNLKEEEKFGIKYTCKFDESFSNELTNFIKKGKIPYEYYSMEWIVFQGASYNIMKKPVNYLMIDNSTIDSNNTFNYYNKTLFNNKFDDNKKMSIKNDFRDKISELFKELELEDLDDNKKFGINDKKLLFENILTIFDDGIQIENKGKGTENLIKTKIALDKIKNKLDVVSIEEPENHLSHMNLRKMLNEIKLQKQQIQLIITTHNNLIINGLNIKNVIWINEDGTKSLKDIDNQSSLFFEKASNNNLLQFLLANKVVLVEGVTEYLLIPKIFEKIYKENLDQNGIDIISCNGITYKHYLEIAKEADKKVAIITDNDKNLENVKNMKDYNSKNNNMHIFMDEDCDKNWTWEACIFNGNEDKMKTILNINEKNLYLFHGENYGPYLGKMLNNKSEIAYQILNSDIDFEYPQYVKDGLRWIKELF